MAPKEKPMQTPTTVKSPSAQISELPMLPMSDLWCLWDKYYPIRPKFPNRKYLEARIGYQIQVAAYGGLPPSTLKRLEAIGSELSVFKTRIHMPPRTIQLTPGTRLIKDWGGKRHEVLVTDVNQFLYLGNTYKSLSAIANRITGTRWSGLAFFGLKNKTVAMETEQ
jgi:hypothetical protein